MVIFYSVVRRSKHYVRVQNRSRNAVRVRAWAETMLYRLDLGVTGEIREAYHGGHDGQDAIAHERVRMRRVEACPSRATRESAVRKIFGCSRCAFKSTRKALSKFCCPHTNVATMHL